MTWPKCPTCGDDMAFRPSDRSLVCWTCRDAGKVHRALRDPILGKKSKSADGTRMELKSTEET